MANTKTVKPAGYINVSKVELRAFSDPNRFVNLVQMYTHVQINESMHSPYVHGHIHIIDSYGMIYQSVLGKRFPGIDQPLPHIHGEELLTIEYEDDASETVYSEQYFVYAVDKIELADKTKETALSYKLYFCSIPKMFSDTFIIRKAYRDMTISEMVRSIFDEYYLLENPVTGTGAQKSIEIEETTARTTITIPALTPEQAIMFLARRAYSSESKSSLFFFWETREKYYFYTHEGLRRLYEIKDTRQAELAGSGALESESKYNYFEYYNGPNDNTPVGQERARTIVTNTRLSPTNSVSHVRNQAYRSRVTEIDVMSRAIRKYEWQYRNEYSKFNNIDDLRLNNTEQFIDTITHANRPDIEYTQSFVVRDYSDPNGVGPITNNDREYPFYMEKLTMAPVFAHHLNSNKMKGDITGRKALFPGDFIYFAIPEFSVDSMRNSQVLDADNLGEQMITSIVSYIEGNKWRQQLEFTKGGKGGGPESLPQELSSPSLTSELLSPGEAGTTPTGPGVTDSPTTNAAGNIQLPNSLANDPAFNAEVDALLAKYPGMSRQDLYRVMKGESAFSPTARNPSTDASGLFQFTPLAAGELGVTTAQVRNMSPAQQVQLYDRYLSKWNYAGGPLSIMQAAPAFANRPANAVIYPVGSEEWRLNAPWRPADGGDITVASINQYYNNQGA